MIYSRMHMFQSLEIGRPPALRTVRRDKHAKHVTFASPEAAKILVPGRAAREQLLQFDLSRRRAKYPQTYKKGRVLDVKNKQTTFAEPVIVKRQKASAQEQAKRWPEQSTISSLPNRMMFADALTHRQHEHLSEMSEKGDQLIEAVRGECESTGVKVVETLAHVQQENRPRQTPDCDVLPETNQPNGIHAGECEPIRATAAEALAQVQLGTRQEEPDKSCLRVAICDQLGAAYVCDRGMLGSELVTKVRATPVFTRSCSAVNTRDESRFPCLSALEDEQPKVLLVGGCQKNRAKRATPVAERFQRSANSRLPSTKDDQRSNACTSEFQTRCMHERRLEESAKETLSAIKCDQVSAVHSGICQPIGAKRAEGDTPSNAEFANVSGNAGAPFMLPSVCAEDPFGIDVESASSISTEKLVNNRLCNADEINCAERHVKLARTRLALVESAQQVSAKFRSKSMVKKACQFCRRSFCSTKESFHFEASTDQLISRLRDLQVLRRKDLHNAEANMFDVTVDATEGNLEFRKQRKQVDLAEWDVLMTQSAQTVYSNFRERCFNINMCLFCSRELHTPSERMELRACVEKQIDKIPAILGPIRDHFENEQAKLSRTVATKPCPVRDGYGQCAAQHDQVSEQGQQESRSCEAGVISTETIAFKKENCDAEDGTTDAVMNVLRRQRAAKASVNELQAMQRNLEDERIKRREAESIRDKCECDIRALSKHVEELESAKAELQEEHAAAQAELARWRSRENVLMDVEEQHRLESEKLRQAREDFQHDRLAVEVKLTSWASRYANLQASQEELRYKFAQSEKVHAADVQMRLELQAHLRESCDELQRSVEAKSHLQEELVAEKSARQFLDSEMQTMRVEVCKLQKLVDDTKARERNVQDALNVVTSRHDADLQKRVQAHAEAEDAIALAQAAHRRIYPIAQLLQELYGPVEALAEKDMLFERNSEPFDAAFEDLRPNDALKSICRACNALERFPQELEVCGKILSNIPTFDCPSVSVRSKSAQVGETETGTSVLEEHQLLASPNPVVRIDPLVNGGESSETVDVDECDRLITESTTCCKQGGSNQHSPDPYSKPSNHASPDLQVGQAGTNLIDLSGNRNSIAKDDNDLYTTLFRRYTDRDADPFCCDVSTADRSVDVDDRFPEAIAISVDAASCNIGAGLCREHRKLEHDMRRKGNGVGSDARVETPVETGFDHELPHRTVLPKKTILKRPGVSTRASNGRVNFMGGDLFLSQVIVKNYRGAKDALWFLKPSANVMCEFCQRRVPQTQGRLRGAKKGHFMLDEFVCAQCAKRPTPAVVTRMPTAASVAGGRAEDDLDNASTASDSSESTLEDTS